MTKVLAAVAWPYANGPRHIGHVAGFGAVRARSTPVQEKSGPLSRVRLSS